MYHPYIVYKLHYLVSLTTEGTSTTFQTPISFVPLCNRFVELTEHKVERQKLFYIPYKITTLIKKEPIYKFFKDEHAHTR